MRDLSEASRACQVRDAVNDALYDAGIGGRASVDGGWVVIRGDLLAMRSLVAALASRKDSA